jgi:hypothetical protein
MDIAGIAALTYLVASVIVIAFQVLLALGAPWGAYAMGGSYPGRLPPAMRVVAAVQAVVLGVLAIVVLSRAGVTARDLTAGYPWLIWVVVAVTAVSVVMNAASRSPGERRLWVPVGLVMLGSSIVVAISVS